MSEDSLTLGQWQGAGQGGDPDRMIEQVETVCAQANDRGVDYLIFPECFLTGYYNPDPLMDVAAKVTPKHLGHLAGLSRRFDMGLQVGSYQADGDTVFNAAHVFLPDAGHIGSYRKRALYGPWEKESFARGKERMVFTFRGFRIGVLICFEIEFPELARDLALQGVDLLAVSTALSAPYDNVARFLVPARAMENRCFVAYANYTGKQGEMRFVGQSAIWSPEGDAMAQADAKSNALLTARLELSERHDGTRVVDYLSDLPDIPR